MPDLKLSPLAPERFPDLPAIAGLRLSVAEAAIRDRGRNDVMLAELAPGSTVAAMFTQSLCTAAPVDWCRRALNDSGGSVRALIANSGNANAFTGRSGDAVVDHIAASLAVSLSAQPEQVLIASTGVIGEDLPVERIDSALPALLTGLAGADAPAWEAAARAICTTDTFAKGACAEVAGTDGRIVGIAKGSGMIAPDMATMLAFVFTDLHLDAQTSRAFLGASVQQSFNRITVDSDTSTSDTVLLLATGAVGRLEDDDRDAFEAALNAVTLDLAHQIVRDGEGASKFVAVTVTGAEDARAARAIARAVADSPLVKTALAASDANWGRIVAAVGKAGQRADRDRMSIWIGDEQCAESGRRRSGYSEERAARHLRGDDVVLRIDVGVGLGEATIWTCDLTHGYIDINAGYRS